MVEPICAFLVSKQQLLPLSRPVICLGRGGGGGGVGFVSWGLGFFWFVGFLYIYELWSGSWSSKELVCGEIWASVQLAWSVKYKLLFASSRFSWTLCFLAERTVVCINVASCDHSFLHIGRADSLVAVEKHQKKRGIYIYIYVYPMTVKHLLLTDCALCVCCSMLHLWWLIARLQILYFLPW